MNNTAIKPKPLMSLRIMKLKNPTMSNANKQLMRKSIMLVGLLLISSCSTKKRTMVASALTSGLVTGVGGSIFSPNGESRNANTYVFGLLGVVAGAAAGYYLHSDNRNMSGQNLENFKNQSYADGRNIYEFSQTNKYMDKGSDIPDHLKSIVPRRRVIEYETSKKLIKKRDKTIIIAPTKAWEVTNE